MRLRAAQHWPNAVSAPYTAINMPGNYQPLTQLFDRYMHLWCFSLRFFRYLSLIAGVLGPPFLGLLSWFDTNSYNNEHGAFAGIFFFLSFVWLICVCTVFFRYACASQALIYASGRMSTPAQWSLVVLAHLRFWFLLAAIVSGTSLARVF